MKISVIIPVYNAEKYLQRAVESALEQEETGEVILVEDGSPDGSLQICLKLTNNHERVRLYRHSKGQNRGAGASRNLGIYKAHFEWIAFLDADDYYLPGRFARTIRFLHKSSHVDGVYEAIGMHYYSEKAKEQWIQKEGDGLTGLREIVPPESLFETLVQGGKGYIHLDGLVVRKACILQCGLFPEQLHLHQDTAFIFQIAICGKLIPGRQDIPVALRGIHDSNRILSSYNAVYTRYLFWKHILFWSLHMKISLKYRGLIVKKWLTSLRRLLQSYLK